jgi:CRISPR-associated endonuclease/helicase Cas3
MDGKMEFLAHVKKNEDGSWAIPQTLENHILGTSRVAESFASKFQSGEWGKVAGLAHDTGKARTEWQNYLVRKSGFDEEASLETKAGKCPHAIYGAKLVEEKFGKGIGRILAYVIAGHHAGLPDWSSAEDAGQSSLQFQESKIKDLSDIDEMIEKNLESSHLPLPPWLFENGLDVSLWIRMLYSSLVDADFLDTESYMDGNRKLNRGSYCSIAELLTRFNQYIRILEEEPSKTKLNEIRKYIREKCVKSADEDQGIFSLSVPTGGGKTLSSLAFGLEHALKHGLDRIIYVIPYTSIIEQNAKVFRNVLGNGQVIEHHSSLDEDISTTKSQLASENWDAPVIVTTSVQFFESLFSSKSSRCRKLHNIVNSVIILDEAQLVPVEYLSPILESLQLLVDRYHVSLVISTATQPAFKEQKVNRSEFKGLKNVKELMGSNEDVRKLYDSLKRVQTSLPIDLQKPTSWEEIAEELKKFNQVLCIVSDRKSCKELHQLMPEGTYHLSALMCGQHRSNIIEEIKQKLKNKEPVRVISTQLVEAGVDIDFPVVYRALAGLDSIAQAAGRCNREGLLPELGIVKVFVAPKKAPMGILRKAAETTTNMLYSYEGDPLEFSLFEKFFSELYWKANSLDKNDIIGLLQPTRDDDLGIFFRTASNRFRIIDDSNQKTILVRYAQGDMLIDSLKLNGPDRLLMRKLQRYTVNIYNYDFQKLLNKASIEEIQPKIFAQVSRFEYSEACGLLVDEIEYDPEKFIL